MSKKKRLKQLVKLAVKDFSKIEIQSDTDCSKCCVCIYHDTGKCPEQLQCFEWRGTGKAKKILKELDS